MTKEKAKELIEVLQAWLEGEIIERKLDDGTWQAYNYNYSGENLYLDENEYRIKPKPTYIPFTKDDYRELIGKAITAKNEIEVKK